MTAAFVVEVVGYTEAHLRIFERQVECRDFDEAHAKLDEVLTYLEPHAGHYEVIEVRISRRR